MKGNQNVANKQVTSNKMTGKLLPFPFCSRSNNRDNRDTSRHRSPNSTSRVIQNHIAGIVTLKHQVERVHHTLRNRTFTTNQITIIKTIIQVNSRAQSPK